MKKIINALWRWGIFLVLLTLTFNSCKKEGIYTAVVPPQEDLNQVKSWFSQNGLQLNTKDNWLQSLTPAWNNTKLLKTDSLVTYEIELQNPRAIFVLSKDVPLSQSCHLKSLTNYRLLIFETMQKITGAAIMELVSLDGKPIDKSLSYRDYHEFTGVVNFYELDGTPSNGWLYEHGKAVRKTLKSIQLDGETLQSAFRGGQGRLMLADVQTVQCGRALVPHTRTVCTGSGGVEGWGYDGSGGGMNCREETYYVSEIQYCQIPTGDPDDGGYTGGGGGGSQPSGDPKSNNPDCATVKQQSQSQDYKNKKQDLKSKTGQHQESGYEEKKDGSFGALNNNGADALSAIPDANTKGYIHNHVDDYATGNVTPDGLEEWKRPIKIFSPGDVNTLMRIIDKNRENSNFSQYYVAIISIEGHYMIKFNGTASDIKTGFSGDQWAERYRDFMQGRPLEKAFLQFVRDEMGLKGIELFEIKNNGDVKTIELGTNDKKIKKDC